MQTHRFLWAAAALALTVPLSACRGAGSATEGAPPSSSTRPAALATAQAPAKAVADAARAYLVARDQAVLAGAALHILTLRLQPGSPAAAAEPLVATGRALVAARRGALCVGASTRVGLGSVAFFQGAEPVAASHASGGAAHTRAEVVAHVLSRITAADGTRQTLVTDHVLTLLADQTGGWLVYEDDYVDPQQAEALAAAGAPGWQVSAARQRVRDLARVRLASVTPAGAVRAFVSLLGARRYLDAGLCLSPAFDGTGRAVGATLRSVRLVATAPFAAPSPARTVLRVTLRVRPRFALWNNGLNVRFFTLTRVPGGAWRISAIDTGP